MLKPDGEFKPAKETRESKRAPQKDIEVSFKVAIYYCRI
jgi:hypothetical protein